MVIENHIAVRQINLRIYVLCISFMWYLKNFLEMFSMYKDNETGKTHHSSSETYQSILSHAILEGIIHKKKIIHSNP